MKNISKKELLSIAITKYLELEKKSSILSQFFIIDIKSSMDAFFYDDIENIPVDLVQIKNHNDIELIILISYLTNEEYFSKALYESIYNSCLDSLHNKTKLIILRQDLEDFNIDSHFKVVSTIKQFKEHLSKFE